VRVAIIHYWLVNWRGGEKVLKAIADLLPDADIYVHVADAALVKREFPGRRVSTTFISGLPFARSHYQKYLSLMPLALEQLDLRGYDLVISSESGPAKGVIVPPGAMHICYCHSPMRYVWDMYQEYTSGLGVLRRALIAPMLHRLRVWDQLSAQRVDHYIANSRFVAQRIRQYYRREADVIHPPVAVEDLVASRGTSDFFLWVGQLVGYKRPDLAVDAFNDLELPLVMIGDGEMLGSLRRRAKANVRLLGRQSWDVVRDHYARCRALVFPGVEDFGMVPVEAMASGKPVIAYAAGGVLETVVNGVTGILFREQSVRGLMQAVSSFDGLEGRVDPAVLRTHAMQFSEQRFRSQLESFFGRKLQTGV
jgi:glycosyltransferase involved in cell wall biosynthesis